VRLVLVVAVPHIATRSIVRPCKFQYLQNLTMSAIFAEWRARRLGPQRLAERLLKRGNLVTRARGTALQVDNPPRNHIRQLAREGMSMPILVVDDDLVFRDFLAGVLRSAGFEVVLAQDGNEAVSLCRELRLDLIVADWLMPGMDGVELCRQLKDDPALRQIYFILLTARDDVPDKVLALDAGADEYVVKPCAELEILARVRAGLRIRRLQEEVAHMEWRLATRELGAAVGHTINNPLTAIANYLELLEQSTTTRSPEATSEMLAGARQEVDRIAGIVRRLVRLRDPRRIGTPLGTSMIDLESDQ
jgi:DNA-binding response OmpR family regulator